MTLNFPPHVLHSLSLSIFSSVVGPFGGFFASGFKRAFKIKVSTPGGIKQNNYSKIINNRILETPFPVTVV